MGDRFKGNLWGIVVFGDGCGDDRRARVETLARLRALGPGWPGVVVRAVEKKLGE